MQNESQAYSRTWLFPDDTLVRRLGGLVGDVIPASQRCPIQLRAGINRLKKPIFLVRRKIQQTPKPVSDLVRIRQLLPFDGIFHDRLQFRELLVRQALIGRHGCLNLVLEGEKFWSRAGQLQCSRCTKVCLEKITQQT